jgi:hypothetical protein
MKPNIPMNTPPLPSSVSITVNDFVYRKLTWEFSQTESGERTVKGIPGSWTPAYEGAPSWLLGILCCPNCGTNLILHSQIHSIDRLGLIHPDIRCNSCSFVAHGYLDKFRDKPLYACAIEVDGKPEIHYMHAQTQQEARIHLGPIKHKQAYRIVAIGPAIGHHVEDEHGEVLKAD